MNIMTTRIPHFGMPGMHSMQINSAPDSHIPTPSVYPTITRTGGPIMASSSGQLFSSRMNLVVDCPYSQVHQQTQQLAFGSKQAAAFLESLKQELPTLIGDEVEKRVAARLDSQKADITTEIAGAKDAMLAKKSSSIVTLNGSLLSVGKITEAWTKTIEALQAVGKAWTGASNAASNVDNASFPRQLGRSMLNGAKGSLKITAGGLGAAVVMSALLATSGIALNKVHDHFPSVPSATSIVASVTGQAEKLKVTVGSVEIEKAGSEAKTLSMQDRAAGLLAQNGNDYGKTMASVNNALSLSLIDGKTEAVESQKKLLEQLHRMQQAQAPVVSAGAVTPTPASGPTM